MAYILPQVRVFQEFQQIAAGEPVTLPAFIFGPNYQLFRYDNEEEKILAGIGEYDYLAGNADAWPNKPVNSTVDQNWTELFMDEAWLQYYRDFVGAGDTVYAVEGFANRIRFSTYNLASYGSWDRASVFKSRDVQAGDGVIIRANACGEEIEVFSRVNRLIHDIVASVVGTPTADINNAPATAASTAISQETGSTGTVDTAASAAAYDGSEDGDTIESYTVTVSVPGDFGTAQLIVTSASGNDDPTAPMIPADGAPAALGTRGATMTFSTASGSPTPFETGQSWRVDVNQNWTPAVCSSQGTYLGVNNGAYIITVIEGGDWASEPKVFISSTGTLDSSGPYTVEDDTWITLPTGVQIKLDGGAAGLAKNDRYYVEVVAEQAGPLRTLELRNSLPNELFGVCYPGDPENPVDLDVTLTIVKDIEVPRIRLGILANWETTATQIQVNSGILSTDSSWYDTPGVPLSLPVILGDMYVQYRALLRTLTLGVNELDDISQVGEVLGDIDDDNPLAMGVYKALQNSNQQPVKYMATDGTDLEAYLAVLAAIYDRDDVYGLVPLTKDKEIWDAVFASIAASSTPDRGRWRTSWFAGYVNEETAVLTGDSSGDILYATISEDPDTPGTQYTRLRCDDAQFITNGVLGGQITRTGYFTDPNTNEEAYVEYIIDEVISEEELRLATGPDAPVTVAQRFEVWKENTKNEMADQVIELAGSYHSRRVKLVWPDMIGNAGDVMDGMFLCCGLAGLRSGVAVHQGLTNVEIAGFDEVTRTTEFFTGVQLDDMAENGVWIVTEDVTGIVYTRHQLTTDPTDINTREDSMTSNMDALSYRFLRFLRDARYIGRRNITPALISQLRADIEGEVQAIMFETQNTTLGPQILDGNLVQIERHPTLRDHIVARLEVDLPEPFNNLDLTIVALAQ